MAHYPPLVAGSLIWLSTIAGLSVSQDVLFKTNAKKDLSPDPQKDLSLVFNHMSAVVDSTVYTVGGTTIYWTPNSTASSIASSNNNSVYILKTASELPQIGSYEPSADQNTIYYWGGELERESIYLNRTFQNGTREWPDPMKYYTYDLRQPRWPPGKWKAVSISEAEGWNKLTSSPSYGKSAYSADSRNGFYLGGAMARYELKNNDGSNATRSSGIYYDVNSMVVFDAVTNVWKNETIIRELFNLRDGVMVYVAGVGERGILVRMGGHRKEESASTPSTSTTLPQEIGTANQPPPKQKSSRRAASGGFCAGAVVASDKTSFTIYGYGGNDLELDYKKGTWALTMPYFQWLPVGTAGELERGRTGTTCHSIGGQLVMVRGKGNQENRGDTNGGSYFYDMTDLTWSLKYRPSDSRVPKAIYDVIGGNQRLRQVDKAVPPAPVHQAIRTSPVVLASSSPQQRTANSSNQDGRSPSSTRGGSSSSTSVIVGGVVGGVAVLAVIGAAI
ncbi:hypothetical protein HOY80DRAFT_1078061 [Tuber brumale]|nr:hypothetical protein HOY80DRAFT_1078061 [Tuber brumale]